MKIRATTWWKWVRKTDVAAWLSYLIAGAVVLPSVFEEQILREQVLIEELVDSGAESFGEALSYFPARMSS